MTETPEIIYCANHPNTETTLRCNRCGKPICAKCAISTPTGYRCNECVRGQQKIFDTTQWYDYLTSFLIASLLAFIGSRLVPIVGFFTIFLAPISGIVIAEAVRFIVRRRRSPRLYKLTAIATVIGCLPALLIFLLTVIPYLSQGGFGVLLGGVWQGLYVFMVTTTTYYRLSGLRIGI
jgi:hypothetical protein